MIPRHFFYSLLLTICLPATIWGDAHRLPSLGEVHRIVQQRLASLPDYRPGDLISRSQVQPIFAYLKSAGWTVRDQAQILKLVPADDEWFVRELRTSGGQAFMRQSAKFPLAYDRIDRLSSMTMGHQNVKALIAGPDGYKMIQYMTTTPYGRNLGQMLSQDPRAADFNSPTGKLYTGQAFFNRLAQSYDVEARVNQPATEVADD